MAGSVQDLMNAIAQMEGYNKPGTIANRNNNPGNLRWASTQIGQESTVNGKYATFATPQDGWAALQSYIQNNQNLSLRDFITKYAPPSENDTSNYLNWLVSQVGVGADTPVSSLFGGGSSNVSSGSVGSDTSSNYSSSDVGTYNAPTDLTSVVSGIDWTVVGIGAIAIGLVSLLLFRR